MQPGSSGCQGSSPRIKRFEISTFQISVLWLVEAGPSLSAAAQLHRSCFRKWGNTHHPALRSHIRITYTITVRLCRGTASLYVLHVLRLLLAWLNPS